MRIWILLLLMVLIGISVGCSGTHAIQCTLVGEQKICFVREVWGFNGDKVALTTSDDVCHEPSIEHDYVSNTMRSQETIFAKVIDGKFHVYAEGMDAPKNPFPIEVVLEQYDLDRHDTNLPKKGYSDFDLSKEGYQEFDISRKNMTWCLRDIF